MIINDPSTNVGAKVSEDNRLYTFSLIEYPTESFSHTGDAYLMASDFIALTTTASFNGIWYVKNTSTTHNIHIEAIRTTSTVNTLWQLIKNPTAGTLVSGGAAYTPVNANFASGKVLSATVMKGADALTITDGTLFGQWMTGVYGLYERRHEGAIIIGPNNAAAVQCKPTGAGSVGCTLSVWSEPLKG